MAQFAVPDGDTATGLGWTNSGFARLDEGAPGGGDVAAQASNNASEFLDKSITDETDPAVSTGHRLRARWRTPSGARTIRGNLELWQGVPGSGTLLAALRQVLGATLVIDVNNLTGGEADSITDYSAIQLRCFYDYQGGGAPSDFEVDFIELEMPDVAGGTTFQRTFTGVIASGDLVGDPTLQTQKPLGGVISITDLTGAYGPSKIAHTPSGTIASGDLTGATRHKTQKLLDGTISISDLTGALVNTTVFARLFAGTIALAELTGDLARQTQKKALAGTIAAGQLVGDYGPSTIRQILIGATTPAGDNTLQTQKLLEGTISSGQLTGAVGNIKKILRLFTGAITTLTGDYGPSKVSKTLAGATTPSGTTIKSTTQTNTGATTPAGALRNRTSKLLSGVIAIGDLTGALTNAVKFARTFTGAIGTLTGALTRELQTTLTGAVTPSGALTRKTAATFAGAVTPSGQLIRKTRLILGAVLTLAGSLANVLITFGAGTPISRILRHQGKTGRDIAHQGRAGRKI